MRDFSMIDEDRAPAPRSAIFPTATSRPDRGHQQAVDSLLEERQAMFTRR
jgi:hypothetical protein